jgi:hypothetical protein
MDEENKRVIRQKKESFETLPNRIKFPFKKLEEETNSKA